VDRSNNTCCGGESERRVNPFPVTGCNEATPCTACVEQLSDNRGSVDCLYGVTWQTMTSQNSQSVESLGAVIDYFSDMVGSRQSISECYAENFESCDSNNAWNFERRRCIPFFPVVREDDLSLLSFRLLICAQYSMLSTSAERVRQLLAGIIR